MKSEWKGYVRFGVTLLLLWMIIHYWASAMGLLGGALSAGFPLILGAIIAYVVNIPMMFFERFLFEGGWAQTRLCRFIRARSRKKRQGRSRASRPKPDARGKGVACRLKRPVSLLLAVLAVLLMIFLLIRTILPELVACVSLLLETLSPTLQSLAGELSAFLTENNLLPDLAQAAQSFNVEETLKKAADLLFKGMNGMLGVVLTTTVSTISNVITTFLALVFAGYLLLGKDFISHQVSRLLELIVKKPVLEQVHHVAHTLNVSFHRYIVGQCTEAVILGVLCILGMLLLRFPYAVMIGTLVGFTALIPLFGAYIGAAVGAFMIFTVNPMQAVWFLVFLVILQQLEGNLIFPRVVGSSIGLPGIWVMAAVTVAGGLFGIVGMVTGVPLAAAVYHLLKEHSDKKRCEVAHAEG